MQTVGTTSPGMARRPAVGVPALAGDVVVLVLTGVWRLVRVVLSGLRRRWPVWSLPTTPQLVPAVAQGAVGGPRFVSASPSAGPFPTGALPLRELTLPADATAPRQARALLQDAAQEWGVDDDLYQDAAMVVTELVANAVDHARTLSTLTLGLDERGGLRIAVRDACPGPVPRPRPVDPAAPRGRGLQMIAALARSWGVTTHIDGKTVWAVLLPP